MYYKGQLTWSSHNSMFWNEVHDGIDIINLTCSFKTSSVLIGQVYSFFRWQHQFDKTGSKKVVVSVLDMQGTILTTLTSDLMVQQPITGLHLTGPQTVVFAW